MKNPCCYRLVLLWPLSCWAIIPIVAHGDKDDEAFRSFSHSRPRQRPSSSSSSREPTPFSFSQSTQQFELHSISVYDEEQRLRHEQQQSRKRKRQRQLAQHELVDNNQTNKDDQESLAAWRALQWFQATRHFSRYELAYRQQQGLDILQNWHGFYNETKIVSAGDNADDWAANGTAVVFTHYDSSQSTTNRDGATNLTMTRQSRRGRRLMNVSSWINNAGHVDSYQSVPLSQGYGTHLANVWVGSPHPQRKTVIVDTGSHFTAFPCEGCRNCGRSYHTDPYYDPRKSETFHQLQCDECIGVMCEDSRCYFSQSYTEGSSWDAIQVKDRFYCGGMDVLDAVEPIDQKYAIDFMFGCMTKVNGLFHTQLADGIMGMSAHEATLTKQLWNRGVLEHNMFALCFRRELGTSKRGVPAGSMTLGGVSTNLDSSPVVYAKNMAKTGWFTVYVKNVYVRAGGGQSAAPTPNTRTVRVHVDLAAINSGKGVIVDSGTTDTYLNKAVGPAFRRAWKLATGRPYSHFPMRLTDEELSRLPTVLVQCHAYAAEDPAVEDYSAIPGYAGNLDPSSPNDLLIAIPATSYMDYSPITKTYTSRLYLTETSGGVLGSNTMQGHNVVFDWRLGRIGFAESSCTYDKSDVPADLLAEEEGYPTDCVVGHPLLSQTCAETVEASLCDEHPTNIALLGTRKWTALVESPGTPAGLTCQETAGQSEADKGDEGDRGVVCRGDGVCEEERACQLTCKELERDSKVHPKPENNEKLDCGDSFWSACDRSCQQTRLHSVAFSDGLCHETSRQTRACHTGACMRESPCLVPYLIHLVFGFRGLAIRDWTFAADDMVAKALVRTASDFLGNEIFTEGDVNVLLTLPWYLDEDNPEAAFHHKSDEDVKPVGVKVVIEISIVNQAYNKTSLTIDDDTESGSFQKLIANWTVYDGHAIKCSAEDLHRLAKLALRLKKQVLNAPEFMSNLIDEMEQTTDEENAVNLDSTAQYFRQVNKTSSRLVATWSVPTGVDEEINYYGPHRPAWYIFLRILHICTIFLMLALLAWSLGGASSSVREFCLRFGIRWHRRQRYISVSQTEDYPKEDGVVTLEMAVHSPSRSRNGGTVLKRKGSQQAR